jgi:hypothetical protein
VCVCGGGGMCVYNTKTNILEQRWSMAICTDSQSDRNKKQLENSVPEIEIQ